MAKLPKSIIRKHGISKKAWDVFRGKRTTKRRGSTMARRKKHYGRKKGSDSLMTTMLAAGVYGAVRPKVEQWVNPITSRIPIAGNYADEVVLGAAGYIMAKGKMPFFKGSLARNAGKAILILEAARVGSGLSQGIMPTGSNNSNFDI